MKTPLIKEATIAKTFAQLAVAFIAKHNIDNPDIDIIANDCQVECYFIDKIWRKPNTVLNLKEGIDRFIDFINNKKGD